MADTATPAGQRAHRAAKRYIYAWGGGTAEGDATMRDLLGGKGAGLAEMTNAGPAGAARLHDHDRGLQRLLRGRRAAPRRAVGRRPRGRQARSSAATGKGFGDAANPLLVSVRSGAKFSMPGMMDTVLNLGLNEETLHGLIALTGNERFGWDAYRRFIQMFGRIVMDVKGERFDHALEAAKAARGVEQDTDLDAPTTCASSPASSRRSSARTPAATSRATRTSSSTSRSRPSSRPGSASAPSTTATTRRSPTTSARRSTS